MSFSTGRTYEIDGLKLPSVTTILSILNKPALIPWAVKMTAESIEEQLHDYYHPECCEFVVPDTALPEMIKKAKGAHRAKSKEAMGIGTRVHDAIQAWIESNGDYYLCDDEQTQLGLDAFLRWADEHKINILSWEQVVTNHATYAGRYDLVCELEGVVTLVDFKTSTGIWDEYWLQLAAYSACLPDVKQVGILRIDKVTGEIEWQCKPVNTVLQESFKMLADFYNNMKGEEK